MATAARMPEQFPRNLPRVSVLFKIDFIMFGFLADPHRRHLLLTLCVGAGLLAYVTGSVRTVYDFDLAMLLALVGGYPTYSGALTGLIHRKITADLAVSLAAMAALWMGWRSPDASSWFLVAAEVIFIMLVGESLEDLAIRRTRSGIAAAGTSAAYGPSPPERSRTRSACAGRAARRSCDRPAG